MVVTAIIRNHGLVSFFLDLINIAEPNMTVTATNKLTIAHLRRDSTFLLPLPEPIAFVKGSEPIVFAKGGEFRSRKDVVFVSGSYSTTRVFSFVYVVQNVSIGSDVGTDDMSKTMYSVTRRQSLPAFRRVRSEERRVGKECRS